MGAAPAGTGRGRRGRGHRSRAAPADDGDDRPLLVELLRGGEVVATDLDLRSARERHARSRAELPPRAHQLSRGEPAIPTVYETARA